MENGFSSARSIVVVMAVELNELLLAVRGVVGGVEVDGDSAHALVAANAALMFELPVHQLVAHSQQLARGD